MNKVKEFFAGVGSWLKDEWLAHRTFIMIVLATIAATKYREILINLITNSGKKLQDETVKKDEVLAKEESDANKQADTLVAQAKEEAAKPIDVDADWYKK